MPTVLLVRGYQFIIFTSDHPPPHVHIRKDGKLAKLRLDTMRLERAGGFNAAEQRQIVAIAQENRDYLMLKWNEFYDENNNE